jgi:hypothetical protein
MLSLFWRVWSQKKESNKSLFTFIIPLKYWAFFTQLMQWSGYDCKVFSHISCNRSKDQESPLICLGVFGLGQFMVRDKQKRRKYLECLTWGWLTLTLHLVIVSTIFCLFIVVLFIRVQYVRHTFVLFLTFTFWDFTRIFVLIQHLNYYFVYVQKVNVKNKTNVWRTYWTRMNKTTIKRQNID